MQILTQFSQSIMYDRTMALKQWIIYSLAEFLGSNSPSCHKIDTPPWLSPLSGWQTAGSLAYSWSATSLNDKTPNISICFQLYFGCYRETSKDKAIANRTCSHPPAPQLPDPQQQSAKIPRSPFSSRITWQLQTLSWSLDYLPFTERLTSHNNSQIKNNHPVSILLVH